MQPLITVCIRAYTHQADSRHRDLNSPAPSISVTGGLKTAWNHPPLHSGRPPLPLLPKLLFQHLLLQLQPLHQPSINRCLPHDEHQHIHPRHPHASTSTLILTVVKPRPKASLLHQPRSGRDETYRHAQEATECADVGRMSNERVWEGGDETVLVPNGEFEGEVTAEGTIAD